VTTNQVLLGAGLILALAVGSQVLASRLRIPALIILLPAGFTAGAITTDINPQDLLGAAFQPLVSLAVAVILYDAGLSLDLRKLRGHTRRVVVRLIAMGVPITLALIDPVGGILGAVVFHAVVASTRKGLGCQLGQFLAGIGAGLAGGIAGTALLWFCCENSSSARCSAPPPSWRQSLPWPPDAT
jgi:predicted Kef-type K+ transport protein